MPPEDTKKGPRAPFKQRLRLTHERYLEEYIWVSANKELIQTQINKGRSYKDIANDRKVHPTTFAVLLEKADISPYGPKKIDHSAAIEDIAVILRVITTELGIADQLKNRLERLP